MMGELRELREQEPLARHTSWRVGGPGAPLLSAGGRGGSGRLPGAARPEEPLLWLGLGSNLLVDDAGFPGTVIQTQACLTRLERRGATGIYAESGVSCAKVARFAARHDLVGCEFLAGIPGTMGGALAMNAGAWGGETWAQVVSVRTIDRVGRFASGCR
jgi:UDP-N-acetylmuramate dehydrogenase